MRMDQNHVWSNRVVGVAAIMVGFAVAHLIDDFLYGVPGDFGLTDPPVQALAGVLFAILAVLIALAARGRAAGFLGTACFGAFLFAADTAKHVDEVLFDHPYRAGLISKAFEVGLMLSGLALAVVSYAAWRSTRR